MNADDNNTKHPLEKQMDECDPLIATSGPVTISLRDIYAGWIDMWVSGRLITLSGNDEAFDIMRWNGTLWDKDKNNCIVTMSFPYITDMGIALTNGDEDEFRDIVSDLEEKGKYDVTIAGSFVSVYDNAVDADGKPSIACATIECDTDNIVTHIHRAMNQVLAKIRFMDSLDRDPLVWHFSSFCLLPDDVTQDDHATYDRAKALIKSATI